MPLLLNNDSSFHLELALLTSVQSKQGVARVQAAILSCLPQKESHE